MSFWVRVGPGLCDLGLESEDSGHWNFYPGPGVGGGVGGSETSGHSYENDPGWGGCCLLPLSKLHPARPTPVCWGLGCCPHAGSSLFRRAGLAQG